MREELQALKEQALKELETAASVDALKDLRVKYLGKKGHMTDILRGRRKTENRPDCKRSKKGFGRSYCHQSRSFGS